MTKLITINSNFKTIHIICKRFEINIEKKIVVFTKQREPFRNSET